MRSRPFQEFVAPIPLAFVLLMLVNDCVLKRTWPGLVSGKLSDVALCFFLPLYGSAILSLARLPLRGRLLASCAFVAALFTSIKTSREASDVYCAALTCLGRWINVGGFVNTVDYTDLVALPMIGLAYRFGVHGITDATQSSVELSRRAGCP